MAACILSVNPNYIANILISQFKCFAGRDNKYIHMYTNMYTYIHTYTKTTQEYLKYTYTRILKTVLKQLKTTVVLCLFLFIQSTQYNAFQNLSHFIFVLPKIIWEYLFSEKRIYQPRKKKKDLLIQCSLPFLCYLKAPQEKTPSVFLGNL